MLACACLFMSCMQHRIFSAASASRLPVGSSAKIRSGSCINARAMATLCFCPPDNSVMPLSLKSPIPVSSSTFFSWRACLLGLCLSKIMGSSMFSSTVRLSSSWKSWKAIPKCFLRNRASPSWEKADKSCPSTRICPESGRSIPLKLCRRVVFPLPEGPIMAAISPLRTCKETSKRTATSCFLVR